MSEGDIVLFHFPLAEQSGGKLRPALVLRKLPGKYDDWLICMISTQLNQEIKGLDEIIGPEDNDFEESGLKSISVIRVTRLAAVDKSVLVGTIGNISTSRLSRIRASLSDWIGGESF
jgi:mRNA interferase MazF